MTSAGPGTCSAARRVAYDRDVARYSTYLIVIVALAVAAVPASGAGLPAPRVVTSTTTHHIFVIAEKGNGFEKVGDHDLTGVLTSAENITSALPDWRGLLWFVARDDGVVGH